VSKTQNSEHSSVHHPSDDPGAAARKTHHLELAQKSQTLLSSNWSEVRKLFDYEPMSTGFPDLINLNTDRYEIAGKSLMAPLWISSMTGGTGEARHINQCLAKAAKKYGLGLGLGSCRQLLHSDEYFEDFNLRPLIGEEGCLMANFGMAQMDQIIESNQQDQILEICKKLQVDGLFIHINPLQEYFQSEGDRWSRSPIELIDDCLELFEGTDISIGVKEVGQGMGPESIKAILERPIDVFEFGAFGGTNFSFLEKMRDDSNADFDSVDLRFVGHTALEMINSINAILNQEKISSLPGIIISGGIRSYLQGHYLREVLNAPSIYGMAMPFLAHASKGQEALESFIESELKGLKMAQQFLKVREF